MTLEHIRLFSFGSKSQSSGFKFWIFMGIDFYTKIRSKHLRNSELKEWLLTPMNEITNYVSSSFYYINFS